MTAYPASRARIEVEANSTYKLTPDDRLVVGVLQVMKLWSNSELGRSFGIDRAAVSRHGARAAREGVAFDWPDR